MLITTNHNRSTLRLVQITDSHLGDTRGDALLGMDTDASLASVVSLVKQEQPQVDVLLATGDLSNTGNAISYQRFAEHTQGIAAHTLWLPGNHDVLEGMETAFTQGQPLPRSAQLGGWQVIMLDSRIPKAVGGNISAPELALLRRELEGCRDRHALVCLHHHPIDIDCEWLDTQRVDNADELFAVLDDFEHVRGLLWGHIHQQVDVVRNGVRLMATPSSCIQFAPRQVDFKLDRLSPGYRWLDLHGDGRIESGVSRVLQHFDIDYEYTGGYE